MADDSFFREVDEELRSDRMKSLWRRFGKYAIGLAVLFVAAIAAERGHDYWARQQAAQSGDRLLEALDLAREGQRDEALGDLASLAADGFGAYPVLARMRAAAVHADTGDFAAAIAGFAGVGDDRSAPAAIRDLARIRAAYLLVDHGSYDEVASRAEAFTGGDHPMRHSAREALGLAAWRAGDLVEARRWFDLIAGDSGVPGGVFRRAEIMLDVIAAAGGSGANGDGPS